MDLPESVTEFLDEICESQNEFLDQICESQLVTSYDPEKVTKYPGVV